MERLELGLYRSELQLELFGVDSLGLRDEESTLEELQLLQGDFIEPLVVVESRLESVSLRCEGLVRLRRSRVGCDETLFERSDMRA